MILEKNQKIIMMGDSVTFAELGHPAGEGPGHGKNWGTGYVCQFNAMLDAFYPDLNIRVLNKGFNGNSTRHILERLSTDCLDHNPDWITLMIGINDIWRQFDATQIIDLHVYIDEYEKNLEEIVSKMQTKTKNIILITPLFFYIDTNEPMRKMRDDYAKVVEKISKKYNTLFVDPQLDIDRYLQKRHHMNICWDRVHPNSSGSMIITRTLLNKIGFDFYKEI